MSTMSFFYQLDDFLLKRLIRNLNMSRMYFPLFLNIAPMVGGVAGHFNDDVRSQPWFFVQSDSLTDEETIGPTSFYILFCLTILMILAR